MGLVSLAVGGLVSATIDQLTGAAYAYPDWITLVAGEHRLYDCSATPRAVLVERGGGYELHRVPCAEGAELSVRCEFGSCRMLAAETVSATP
ncbi:MAG: hypothetical protein WKG52_18970 [Variovorax sp.]